MIPLILLVVFYVIWMCLRLLQKNRGWKTLFLIIPALLLLPAVWSVFYLLSDIVKYSAIMDYPIVLILVFSGAVWEKSRLEFLPGKNPNSVKTWAGYAVLPLLFALLVGNYSLVASENYAHLETRFYKDYALMTRISDRIEQSEFYEPGMKIAFFGTIPGENYPETSFEESGALVAGSYDDSILFSTRHFVLFMRYYLNITYEEANEEEEDNIKVLPEFISMPIWPDAGSLTKIDDILVVKINNNYKQP